MAASQKQLQIYIYFRNSYTYFTFQFFMFLLSKDFGKKRKHAELALNYVCKQYFSQKTHSPSF